MSHHSLLLAIMLLVLSCTGSKPEKGGANYHDYIKENLTPTDMVFPGQSIELSNNLSTSLAHAVAITDIIPVSRVIKLEAREGSEFSQIQSLVCVKNRLYLIDAMDYRILAFDMSGSFIGPISAKGMGPGEYQMPLRLKKCYNDNLCFYDALTGSITVLDEFGDYVKKMNQSVGDKRVVPGSNFSWKTSQKLFIATFKTFSKDAPWHVILDSAQDDYAFVYGFGERADPFKEKGWGSHAYPIFEEINGGIWTGSPYRSSITVFDRAGRKLNTIGDWPRVSSITEDEFNEALEGDDKIKAREAQARTTRNTNLLQVGDLVFHGITYARKTKYDIYDINGNLLKRDLTRNHLRPLLAAEGLDVYSEILPFEHTNYYNDEDFEAMKAAGFSLTDNANDNPYIRVGTLVQ